MWEPDKRERQREMIGMVFIITMNRNSKNCINRCNVYGNDNGGTKRLS